MERLPCTAKVFVVGKAKPLYLAKPSYEDLYGVIASNEEVLVAVTTTDGEQMALVTPQIVTVAPYVAKPAQIVDLHELFGVKYTIHGAHGQPGVIEVLAEDLAEATLFKIDVDTDELTEVNGAVPDAAIRRLVRVVRLIQEAETLTQLANTPDGVSQNRARYGVGYTEDEANALAHLERGDTAAAEAIAGEEFVRRIEAEGMGIHPDLTEAGRLQAS